MISGGQESYALPFTPPRAPDGVLGGWVRATPGRLGRYKKHRELSPRLWAELKGGKSCRIFLHGGEQLTRGGCKGRQKRERLREPPRVHPGPAGHHGRHCENQPRAVQARSVWKWPVWKEGDREPEASCPLTAWRFVSPQHLIWILRFCHKEKWGLALGIELIYGKIKKVTSIRYLTSFQNLCSV